MYCRKVSFLVNDIMVVIRLPTNPIFLKAFSSDFSEIEVRFTDQNSQPLKIEDRIKFTLVIN